MIDEHGDAGRLDAEAYEVEFFLPDRPVEGTVYVRPSDNSAVPDDDGHQL